MGLIVAVFGAPRLDQLGKQDQSGAATLQREPALTTTGATNDHTVHHAWAAATVYAWAPGSVFAAPYGQPPQAPRKRRTWLIALLAILSVMLIGVVSCGALIGTAGKAVTEVSASQQASQQAEEDRNAPREVTPGKAFTIGSHKVLEGWKVEADSTFGDPEFQVTGKAKNVSDATSTMFIHLKFVDKSGEVLGNVDCSTGDLEPGQIEQMNCLSDGHYTSEYDKVTAEANF